MDNNNKNNLSPLEQIRELNAQKKEANNSATPRAASNRPAPVRRVAPQKVEKESIKSDNRNTTNAPKPIRAERPAPIVASEAKAKSANRPTPTPVKSKIASKEVANGDATMVMEKQEATSDTISVAAISKPSQKAQPNRPIKKNASPSAAKPVPKVRVKNNNQTTDPSQSDNNSKRDSRFAENVGRGIVKNSVKAVIYIVCVFIVSACLALSIVLVGNDVFALVKDEGDVTITIPEGADLDDIASVLKENKIINYPSIFKLYVNLRGKGADEYLYGDFTVSASMPYDLLISQFKRGAGSRTEISITFTEGMDVDDVINAFVENGIGTREKFIEVIQNYDFDYWFVDELDQAIAANPDSGRIYRLEGYLFPDTYNFYSDSTEETCIDRMLANFNAKFDDTKKSRCQELGMTCDQIVTLASIIQKEAKYANDYQYVSSVFYNRINKGMKLESNATVQYTMPDEEVRLELTYEEIEKYDNSYNTYKYDGLPVGSITNPSLNAINFALYPADTDYYYFVSDSQGYNKYATTSAQHEKNKAAVKAES